MAQLSNTLPVIGISPGNPYFSHNSYENVDFVIEETRKNFPGQRPVVVMIPDIPDRANWEALGASDPVKESKNASRTLKNHVRKYCESRNYSEDGVKILDWENEIGDLRLKDEADAPPKKFRAACKAAYEGLMNLYALSPAFRDSIDRVTADVLRSKRDQYIARGHIKDITADAASFQNSVSSGIAYILSEFAFLEAAPRLFGKDKATYIYHRAWKPYERYLAGSFDGSARPNLDYHVIETESEMHRPIEVTQVSPMRSGPKKLRAAFSDYAPGMYYENGQPQGIFYDLFSEVARRRGYELEIVEESGYGIAVRDMQRGRYDLFCGPVWETPERVAEASLTDAVFSSEVGVFVRSDSPIIRAGVESLNDEKYIINIRDNDITDMYVRRLFPEARTINTPQLEPTRELLARVLDGRSAATIVDPVLAEAYIRQNGLGGKLKNIATIDTVTNHFMLPRGREEQMIEFNAEIARLAREGYVRKLVEKYTGRPDSFIYPPGPAAPVQNYAPDHHR